MPRRRGDLTKGRAVAQVGCPDVRTGKSANQRTIWLGLTVADDDLSFDTASTQFEGSLNRQNRAVHLIGLDFQRLDQTIRIQPQDNALLLVADLPTMTPGVRRGQPVSGFVTQFAG